MEPVKSKKKDGSRKKCPERARRYPADFKLQVVKKYLEESIPASVIRQECGLGTGTVNRWVRAYRHHGEAGLATGHTGKGKRLPDAVKQKIVEIKEANPLFGIKRISQLLRRMFFLSASPETVRTTLHSFPIWKRSFFPRSTPGTNFSLLSMHGAGG